MNRITIDGHMLAFRDEGCGPAIVFVHGTPSSSAEFAEVIAGLRTSFRCIAIDHLGFGDSAKPPSADYSITAHRRRLEALLAQLGVRDYHLVVHDFGGAIGLPLALDHPERIVSITLMNTWLWPLEQTEPTLRAQRWLLRSPLMKFLYRYANLSARVLVKAAWGTYRPLSRAQHLRYQRAFVTANDRSGTIAFLDALLNVDEPAWTPIRDLADLAARPVMLLWGMGDSLVTPRTLERWRQSLPTARVVPLDRVGHFVSDEAPELVVAALRAFLTDAAAQVAEAS